MAPNSRLVYSTDGSSQCPQCNKQLRKCKCDATPPNTNKSGPLKIELSTKGRNGKVATVISGLNIDASLLKPLLKELKVLCGVGGALKGSTIELQGDQQQKVRDYLKSKVKGPK